VSRILFGFAIVLIADHHSVFLRERRFAQGSSLRLFIGVYGTLRLRSGQAEVVPFRVSSGCSVFRSLLSRALSRFMLIVEIFRSLLSCALSRFMLIAEIFRSLLSYALSRSALI
jgi:hypothetical protein